MKGLEQKIEQDKVSLQEKFSPISYFFKYNCRVSATLLNQTCVFWQDVVLDLINQTRDCRSELSQKDQTITHLSGDIKDITVLYSSYFTLNLS